MKIPGPVKFKLMIAGLGALALGGIAVGASAYATGAVSLLAATPTPAASPKSGAGNLACQDFLKHLAQNVGKNESDTRAAIIKSADQTIDDAVKAGKITAAQGATLKQRIATGNLCNFGGRLGERRPGIGIQMELIKAAAQTLNITPQQLMQDVRQGKSLSELANGMSEDQFRTALLKNLKTDLDSLVSQGKLTQQQETDLLNKLQTAPVPFWNGFPRFGGPRSGGPRPGAPVSPAPSTTSGTSGA